MKWRVGRKVPLNVYEGDRPVCQCHTPEDARRIVHSVNRFLFDPGTHEPQTEQEQCDRRSEKGGSSC